MFADAADNMKLMDAAEQEFEREHAFEVPEGGEPAVPDQPPFDDKSVCVGDSTMSRSDYFLMGTSAIGSLEKDMDKIERDGFIFLDTRLGQECRQEQSLP